MKMQMVSWCDEAAAALGKLIDPDMLPFYLKWIREGIATLWRITGDDYVTWLITRIEVFPSGTLELVLDAIEGKNCREIVRVLKERAKSMGFKSMRFETHHSEKLAKKFIGGLGFERAATVFRVGL